VRTPRSGCDYRHIPRHSIDADIQERTDGGTEYERHDVRNYVMHDEDFEIVPLKLLITNPIAKPLEIASLRRFSQ
jgi:hypothetical protein